MVNLVFIVILFRVVEGSHNFTSFFLFRSIVYFKFSSSVGNRYFLQLWREQPCSDVSIVWASMQDLLLVLYLANLTKTQLTLAEKLNTAAQIV